MRPMSEPVVEGEQREEGKDETMSTESAMDRKGMIDSKHRRGNKCKTGEDGME
jgi:hypothetical protein